MTVRFTESLAMAPPSQLEVVLFWASGIVIMMISGGVAIYASHFHLWN
jgi:cytochrome c-type biogenesis protein CcmH/NrfF